MRQALLYCSIILLLTGCALKSPHLESNVLPWPAPADLQAYGRYELTYPGHQWHGEILLLEDAKGRLYFEGPTPFGLTLFQGNLEGETIKVLFFPVRRLYYCTLNFSPTLTQALPYLLLGRLPLSWRSLIKAIRVHDHKLQAYFQAQGLDGRITWQGDALEEVVLWKGTTRILVVCYQRGAQNFKVSFQVPKGRLSLKLALSSYAKRPLPPDFYRLRIPPGFKVFSCVVDSSL